MLEDILKQRKTEVKLAAFSSCAPYILRGSLVDGPHLVSAIAREAERLTCDQGSGI